MRKKILFSAAAVAVMGVASFAVLTSNNHSRELSDLELANIEALTDDETRGFASVTKKELPESAPGCICAGQGDLYCCNDPLFPGWN